ncbi:hypothetical protein HDA40_002748 [Hamadaea flava]|uniref:Uncharacterized protein n=1 Tax=Hamadaea flava TaxID=1742688 RepID=A0ABV8LGC6_9ACTN|nr:hypothetical protein [Hamadaea flava]MCP2324241.1 hypothetical protein [Hamadaea flava]
MAHSEPQALLVNRIVRGQASHREVDQAAQNFQDWLRDEWAGDQTLSLAYCVNELADAYEDLTGRSWQTVSMPDASAHIWMFSFLCPRRADLSGQALEYLGALLAPTDRFAAVARQIRVLRGESG